MKHYCTLLLVLVLSSFWSGTFAQNWDDRNQGYNQQEAREAVRLAEAAYFGNGNPSLPNGYSLVGTYGGGSDWAFVARKNGACAVAFRGSENVQDWISNLNFVWSDFRANFGSGNLMTWSHTGFRRGYENVRGGNAASAFLNATKNCLGSNNRLILAGHSRGGSIASHMGIQFALDSSLDDGGYNFSRFRTQSSSSLALYTFGEPRIVSKGNQGNPWNAVSNIRKWRFVFEEDVASSVPPNLNITPFKHFGATWHMTGGNIRQVDNDYPTSSSQTGSVSDHSLSNYINALGA
jgi:hypothetical protein